MESKLTLEAISATKRMETQKDLKQVFLNTKKATSHTAYVALTIGNGDSVGREFDRKGANK